MKIVKGYKRYDWEKLRDRNEALDCRVYGRAAASMIGIDRFKNVHWEKRELETGAMIDDLSKKNELEQPRKKVIITRRKSKFL